MPSRRLHLEPSRPLGILTSTLVAAVAAASCGGTVLDQGSSGTDAATSSTSTASGTGGATSVASTSASTSSAGGGGQTASSTSTGIEPAPPFRNPVDLPDTELAWRALQLLGAEVEGAEDGCVPCHTLSQLSLEDWEAETNAALSECLTALDVPNPEIAREMIDCVRNRSRLPGDRFSAHALGFWAAGAKLPWWEYTFRMAYGDEADDALADFVAQVQMPPNGVATLSDDGYDIVAEWFVRGAPLLDEYLDEEVLPGECDALITPSVGQLVTELAQTGWRAVNTSNGMLMYGCAGASAPLECLPNAPAAPASWHVAGNGALKVLEDTTYASAYWTRGSASGRYVAHGTRTFAAANSAVLDLQAKVTIAVDALYDPAFFPDDSGFMFQGGVQNVCSLGVLAGPPASVDMTEPGCSGIQQIGLYQQVGAALGGGDYFAVSGQFESDDGGHYETLQNPRAGFGSMASTRFTPMIFDGTTFNPKSSIQVQTAFEGDAVLSPSARMMITRARGQQDRQRGFTLRRVDATPDGAGSYAISTPVIGRYCQTGGKPSFSYDERWIVFHHYVEDSDADAQALGFADRFAPAFAPYVTHGAANVYLIELATNQVHRITHMSPGQYALFPYFRNDGWIYFMVRTLGSNTERVIASSAALVHEGL